MKRVMLDYASKEFSVSEEGYAVIRALITQHQLCDKCRQPIDQADHLLVGKNLCLECLLTKQPRLTFVRPETTDDDGDITYSFLDEESMVYTIKTNSGEDTRKDVFLSIQRAGFPIPESYVPSKGDKTAPVRLGRSNWTVYGKLTSSVIVLEYTDSYPTVRVVFLSYKEGQVVELHKRSLAFKQTFERAKQIIERTKHRQFGSSYYYHPDGYEISQISDSALYPIIAQLEAAVWDVQRQCMLTHQQQELPLEEAETRVAQPSPEEAPSPESSTEEASAERDVEGEEVSAAV